MSKYKVGDKVLVEGEIKRIDSGDNYEFPYKVLIAGLERINFSEDELRHATKTYEDGLNDAWELARKIENKMSLVDLKHLFNSTKIADILDNFTPQEALAKIEAHGKSKQIEIGDVVIDLDGNERVVLHIEATGKAQIFSKGGVTRIHKEHLKKTGRHIDIEHLLEQIRGDD